MPAETAWVKCQNCLFSTRRSIIIQFKCGDVDRWQYCPSCGEEWKEEEIGKTVNV